MYSLKLWVSLCLILKCLVLKAKVDAVPLQWEQIQPIGKAPDARYSHTSVTFSSSQGIVYLFGGFSGLSAIDCSNGCTFYNDVWLFDTAAQGWNEVTFAKTQASCASGAVVQSAPDSPTKRAEHAMVSCGSIALMCGGFTVGPTFLQDGNGQLDCWWLSPLPAPRWSPAIFQPYGSAGPSPRHGHSLVFDPDSHTVLLFGGRDASFTALSDCWWIAAADPDPAATFQWLPCSDAGVVSPSPRFGHGAAVFRQTLYVLGGFASNGLGGAAPQDDIWALPDYAGNGSWAQAMPTSESPGGRAYFGCWQSGFLLHVAGGEGTAAALQDTWSYNFYTKVGPAAASARAPGSERGGRGGSGEPKSARAAAAAWPRRRPPGAEREARGRVADHNARRTARLESRQRHSRKASTRNGPARLRTPSPRASRVIYAGSALARARGLGRMGRTRTRSRPSPLCARRRPACSASVSAGWLAALASGGGLLLRRAA
jgi:hypothetical protein